MLLPDTCRRVSTSDLQACYGWRRNMYIRRCQYQNRKHPCGLQLRWSYRLEKAECSQAEHLMVLHSVLEVSLFYSRKGCSILYAHSVACLRADPYKAHTPLCYCPARSFRCIFRVEYSRFVSSYRYGKRRAAFCFRQKGESQLRSSLFPMLYAACRLLHSISVCRIHKQQRSAFRAVEKQCAARLPHSRLSL